MYDMHGNYVSILNSTVECVLKGGYCSGVSLEMIRYIHSSRNVQGEYFVNLYKSLNCKQHKDRVLQLPIFYKDLEGIKYIIDKCQWKYPDDLYLTDNLLLASELNDLEGIKYIYEHFSSANYIEFYSYHVFKSDFERLLKAVHLNDINYISNLVVNNVALKLENVALQKVLKLAYYLEEFEIAEHLIKYYKMKFSLKYFVRANPIKTLDKYNKHIEKLNETCDEKSFTMKDKLAGEHLIASIFFAKNVNQCFLASSLLSNAETPVEVLMVMISNKESVHFTVSDIATYLKERHSQPYAYHMLIPHNGHDPFFHLGVITHPYKDYFVYVPKDSKYFNEAFVHELGHLFFDKLFCNNAKPYSKISDEMRQKYWDMKDAVLERLKLYVEQSYTDSLEKPFTTDSFEGVLSQNLEYYLYPINIKNLPTYEKLSNNWPEGFGFFLFRYANYYFRYERNSPSSDAEFLVRIPEVLFVYPNSEILQYLLEPAIKYWQEEISPRVRVMDEGLCYLPNSLSTHRLSGEDSSTTDFYNN